MNTYTCGNCYEAFGASDYPTFLDMIRRHHSDCVAREQVTGTFSLGKAKIPVAVVGG